MTRMKKRKWVFVVGSFLCRLPPWPTRSIIRVNLDWLNYLKVSILNLRFLSFRVTLLRGTFYWLTDDWSNNYFHWTFDVLTKISQADPAQGVSVIVPESLASKYAFVNESLLSLGFQVIPLKRGRIYLVEEAFTSPMQRYFSKEGLTRLKNRVFHSAEVVKRSDPSRKRIFISRKLAARRKLVNEYELLDVLKPYGFVSYDLERLSWPEQVALFRNAEAIVGMHGAGLTNMIYAQSACLVVELRPEGLKNNLFRLLAQNMGIHYRQVSLQSENTDFHGPSFFVDTDRLTAIENFLPQYLDVGTQPVSR